MEMELVIDDRINFLRCFCHVGRGCFALCLSVVNLLIFPATCQSVLKMAMLGQSFIFSYLVFIILFPSGFLFLACCYSLASVRATTPRLGWIDVCSYSDPTGSSCCSPGMENKEYMVIPEKHDWFEHSVACR